MDSRLGCRKPQRNAWYCSAFRRQGESVKGIFRVWPRSVVDAKSRHIEDQNQRMGKDERNIRLCIADDGMCCI